MNLNHQVLIVTVLFAVCGYGLANNHPASYGGPANYRPPSNYITATRYPDVHGATKNRKINLHPKQSNGRKPNFHSDQAIIRRVYPMHQTKPFMYPPSQIPIHPNKIRRPRTPYTNPPTPFNGPPGILNPYNMLVPGYQVSRYQQQVPQYQFKGSIPTNYYPQTAFNGPPGFLSPYDVPVPANQGIGFNQPIRSFGGPPGFLSPYDIPIPAHQGFVPNSQFPQYPVQRSRPGYYSLNGFDGPPGVLSPYSVVITG